MSKLFDFPLLRIGIIVIALLAVCATSVMVDNQAVYAHSAPSGCSATSESTKCYRCGSKWWKNKREVHKIKYKCSNGSSGSHTHKGSCGSC